MLGKTIYTEFWHPVQRYFIFTSFEISEMKFCCLFSEVQSVLYSLYAVSNHSGSTYGGHYTAYCKHPISKEWHCFNDSRWVTPYKRPWWVSSDRSIPSASNPCLLQSDVVSFESLQSWMTWKMWKKANFQENSTDSIFLCGVSLRKGFERDYPRKLVHHIADLFWVSLPEFFTYGCFSVSRVDSLSSSRVRGNQVYILFYEKVNTKSSL